jgi:ssDNA thymidine ADP-ribosyltransferase, DarT
VTPIYHITHVTSLVSIFQRGGLLCDRSCNDGNVQTQQIGYAHIKQRRMARIVPLPPNGTLGDYVPFYFAPRSPMLYTIERRNTPDYQEGQGRIVHLVSSIEAVRVAQPPIRWLFTDGHADMEYSDFFSSVNDLEKVDWPLMTARFWNDTSGDGDRKRRRQAEFLVHRFFPWTLIQAIGVIDQGMADETEQVLRAAAHRPEVLIERSWYY